MNHQLALQESEAKYQQNHLISLLDGFVDLSELERYQLSFKGLSLNSKEVHEGYLFLACAGSKSNKHHHGVAYAGEAINSGACCVLWEPDSKLTEMPLSCTTGGLDIPLIRVEKLSQKAGEIAARFYQWPSRDFNVIGITGTNGKTSTAHFVARMLTEIEEKPCTLLGTLGNGFVGQLQKGAYTTPDAVTLQALMARYKAEDAKTLVMEVSSHALSQGRVNGVDFDTAVFTNLTRDHLDYHGDMEAYAAEKLKLFQVSSLKHIIVNNDDDLSHLIRTSVAKQQWATIPTVLGYSKTDSHADYFAKDLSFDREGICFTLCVNNEHYIIQTNLAGEFNIDNLLAAIAVLHSQGCSIKKIVTLLKKIKTVPGRMEKISIPSEQELPLIVLDYAHTPDALEKSLQSLKLHSKGKLYCIFGCGGERDKGKRPLMARVAQQIADDIIVTSDNPRNESEDNIIADISRGFDQQANVLLEKNRELAIHHTLEKLTADDVLLIAGKGHEEYQEIKGQHLPFSDKQAVTSFYQLRAKV